MGRPLAETLENRSQLKQSILTLIGQWSNSSSTEVKLWTKKSLTQPSPRQGGFNARPSCFNLVHLQKHKDNNIKLGNPRPWCDAPTTATRCQAPKHNDVGSYHSSIFRSPSARKPAWVGYKRFRASATSCQRLPS